MNKNKNLKTALITTTVFVPEVLKRYRFFDSGVTFFIAGDRRTPHRKVRALVKGLGNAFYYSDKDQEKLGYRCSPLIGWNKIMRRNIALLEALKWGADILISIDDDNRPLNDRYFSDFRSILSVPFNGKMVSSKKKWFNAGEFLVPSVYHRGFPYRYRQMDLGLRMKPTSGVKIGVAAGMWLGDPDIDAVERLANKPVVTGVSDILQSGLALSPGCFSPFNTQNTAFIRELAPLMMVLVGVGRFDDIFASYIAERILMETEYRVHYGKPFVRQERNAQDLFKNLEDEIFGMRHTIRFCQDLLTVKVGRGSILQKLRRLYGHLRKAGGYLPSIVFELGEAWCHDIEKFLK